MEWKDLFSYLQNNNIEVYATSQKLGDCINPYVVIKSNMVNKMIDFSTTTETYDFLCYHPRRSELDNYVKLVKGLIKDLRKQYLIRDLNITTPEYYDDSVKGYMISFQFIVYRKIEVI